ncbi:hypothetical protein JTB14_007641 [Gonioctena quinquepunctata]|nr:hypothetical protein JTB14_007641 [Gonioctena quinquepunctata]
MLHHHYHQLLHRYHLVSFTTLLLNNNAVDDPALITNAAEADLCATSTEFDGQRARKRKRQNYTELQEEEGGPTPTYTHGRTGIDMNEMKNDSSEFESILWGKKICNFM